MASVCTRIERSAKINYRGASCDPKTDTNSHVRCSFGGTAGLLEKRDFIERLQELRDKAKDVQNGTLPPPKVVSAPTPTVPSAKDVMPIDPNLTDEDIEAMSLAEIKEVLKFHGAGDIYILCLPSIAQSIKVVFAELFE